MEMKSFDAISRDDNPLIISEIISLSRLENAFKEKSGSSSWLLGCKVVASFTFKIQKDGVPSLLR
jgi:hypothetical protein